MNMLTDFEVDRLQDIFSSLLLQLLVAFVLSKNVATKALQSPFVFLFTEAIVQFSALYNGYVYGLSFLFNSAFVIFF